MVNYSGFRALRSYRTKLSIYFFVSAIMARLIFIHRRIMQSGPSYVCIMHAIVVTTECASIELTSEPHKRINQYLGME